MKRFNHPARFVMAAVSCGVLTANAGAALESVTFAVEPEKTYVPLEDAARRLGWPLAERGDDNKKVRINELEKRADRLRRLADGTILVSLADLEAAGATITQVEDRVVVSAGESGRKFKVVAPEKRVEIDLDAQKLRAWQGARLIVDSRISSGRYGNTPAGDFTAGPYKARQHYSKKYNGASMPWSVQVTGHFFIHGFTSVPDFPASHGCIRMPLDGGNPARVFYEWVDVGTPIKISKGEPEP